MGGLGAWGKVGSCDSDMFCLCAFFGLYAHVCTVAVKHRWMEFVEEQCIMNVLYDLYSWNVLSNTAARHETHFSRNLCQNYIQSDLV